MLGVYEQRCLRAGGARCACTCAASRDPGNVGTVLRAALAFGASCVALGPGCADPHSPKAVRASMGAIFDGPARARERRAVELPGERIALIAGAPSCLCGPGSSAPAVTLLVGAERAGPARCARGRVRAGRPHPDRADSLNAAMAATVALYELARSERERGGFGRAASSRVVES